MIKKFKPVNEKVKGFLHGGDYNPDQWLDYPEILKLWMIWPRQGFM